ncbi:hypothetical protein RB195_010175 [Necator americanus]|uniref:Uncharacterized protein n=1 Tax=Necator americanus TaxID=51031 RepID=A0ABR1D043_NECAM
MWELVVCQGCATAITESRQALKSSRDIMFRKPNDDDDCVGSRKVVKAKPLPMKYSQKLSMTGKDFVSFGSEGGNAYTRNESEANSSSSLSGTSLTEDEKNKIHAKILKAEMKGDMELVEKLKRKLEGESATKDPVILLKRSRSGNIMPAHGIKDSGFVESSSRIQREYGKNQTFRDMVQEEKSSSAEDQLMLFHKSIIVSYISKSEIHEQDSISAV